MELGIGGLKELRKAEIVQTAGRGTLTIKIDGNSYEVTLLKVATSEIEFILKNKYYRAKVIQSESHETTLLIHTNLIAIRTHPRMQEILKRSLSVDERGEGGDKDVKSQIPGRVVNVIVQEGLSVKKGDPIVVLESMKMQVAVKAHRDGIIKQIKVAQGDTVARYDIVAMLD